jgi:hypothetical protein
MNRFLFIKTFAMVAVMVAAAQSQADGHGGRGVGGPGHGSMHSWHDSFSHSFKPSGHFNYGKYGYRSFPWTKYGWSSRFNSYCYWAPNYGWCFYEPTYSCYLPISYYQEVYPQAVLTAAPTVGPAVIQQTDVVLAGPPAPVNVPVPVAPAPAVVQQTKVLAGAAPIGDVVPGPVGPGIVPTPGIVQQNKIGPKLP